MNQEGPRLEKLTRRLIDTPEVILYEPVIKNKGDLSVPALVGDLLRFIQGTPGAYWPDLSPFTSNSGLDRNRLRMMVLVTYLLHDDWFQGKTHLVDRTFKLLATGLDPLAKRIEVNRFIEDPDRREELIRYCLAQLDLRPSGERINQAKDRLHALDTVEAERVLQATKAAEEKARRLREEIKRRLEEEEAAAKSMRE
ncbi:MAG: hypothetical protein JNN12_10710 [Bacteroidetes Order II. Incertae sedis bacterium]|nr:hypothetical protein [Bacteroidetes Order II. bacterium]